MSRKLTEIIKNGKEMFSFEVMPDVTRKQLEDMDYEPLFFSITWHAQLFQCMNYEIAPLKLAYYLRSKNKNVLLHISCVNMKKDYANVLLTILQKNDICNLLIILGDRFDPTLADFKSSQEFIFYIKQRYGNYFCIGVAGFPDCDDKILQLKEKIDNGADFVITQAFFEYNIYKNYIMKCEELGIHVPIIPGIFPFETKHELESLLNLCKLSANDYLKEIMKKSSGMDTVAELIRDVTEQSQVNCFHLFTVNKIERAIKLINKVKSLSIR